MELFEMVHLTKRRLAVLVLCAVAASAVAVSYARELPRSYEAESVVFASQLFRDARSDAELYSLIDDLIIATELPQVTDAIEQSTGLEHATDYTLAADRTVAGGISVTLMATAAKAEDAEAVVRSASRSALSFIVGQDRVRAEGARDSALDAMNTTLEEMNEIEEEAGGLSPAVLATQAEELLATLINERGPQTAATPQENLLRARLVELRPMAREYQRLEFLLEGYRAGLQGSLGAVERADSVSTALDSDIVVDTRPEQASLVPLLVQAVLVAVGVTFALGCALFFLIDRLRRPRAASNPEGLDTELVDDEHLDTRVVSMEVLPVEERPAPVSEASTNGETPHLVEVASASSNGTTLSSVPRTNGVATARDRKPAAGSTSTDVPRPKRAKEKTTVSSTNGATKTPAAAKKSAPAKTPTPAKKSGSAKNSTAKKPAGATNGSTHPRSTSTETVTPPVPITGKRPVRQLKSSAVNADGDA